METSTSTSCVVVTIDVNFKTLCVNIILSVLTLNHLLSIRIVRTITLPSHGQITSSHCLTLRIYLLILPTESVDNFSDHLPLSFSFTYNHPIIVNANATSYSNQINIVSSHIVNWDRVTEGDSINYCDYVRKHLPDIPEELVSCCNPNCSTHTTDLNAVCLQLLSCLEEGAIQCLPMIQYRCPAVPS